MNEEQWIRIAGLWTAMHSECISRSSFLVHLYAIVNELDTCPTELTELSNFFPKYDMDFLNHVELFLGHYASSQNLVLRAIASALNTGLVQKTQLPRILSDQFLDDETMVLHSPNARLNDLHEDCVTGAIDLDRYSNELAKALFALE